MVPPIARALDQFANPVDFNAGGSDLLKRSDKASCPINIVIRFEDIIASQDVTVSAVATTWASIGVQGPEEIAVYAIEYSPGAEPMRLLKAGGASRASIARATSSKGASLWPWRRVLRPFRRRIALRYFSIACAVIHQKSRSRCSKYAARALM